MLAAQLERVLVSAPCCHGQPDREQAEGDEAGRYQILGLGMARVRDGRIVERWALLDSDAIRAQLRSKIRGSRRGALGPRIGDDVTTRDPNGNRDGAGRRREPRVPYSDRDPL
jgi:hypothetical protein